MDVFAALADPVRRSLLEELTSGSCRVVDLAASRPISRPAVSKHLRLLSEAGLVVAADRGRERHYALESAGLAPVADLLGRLAFGATPLSPQSLDALDMEVRRSAHERRMKTSSNPQEDTA
jgi:DNA-binding transcriptional ArsR family regulator